MAESGRPADAKQEDAGPATWLRTGPSTSIGTSPKGGYRPSRGFLLGMAGVVFFAGVLAAAGAVAATRDSQTQGGPPLPPPPPVEITTPPRPVTPEPDLTREVRPDEGVPVTDAGAAEAVASSSPVAVASSWSMAPTFAEPPAAAAAGPSARWLAQQAAALYGVQIVLDGQDWGDDEATQVENIGAVISAMAAVPASVSSSVASHPTGPLTFVSNDHGRTRDGWQPYGDTRISFYTNSDQGQAGYRPAHQVVLARGADRMAVAHEVLHAYQFRNAAPDQYALVLLDEEMRSFMAATGWRQKASDDEVLAAAHQPWEAIAKLFAYEGRTLTYTDEAGRAVTLDLSNPIEAFATAGAIYYAHSDGLQLPDWPEYWSWFRQHLG